MTTAAEGRSREGELLAGRYTLLARLGGGGIGEVYKARDTRLKRDVAVKLLRPEHTRSRDVVERLLREAQVTDQVRHPNVVEVFDVDVDPSGVPFIVQELLRGQDLAEHVGSKGGKLSVDEALEYMIPVCDAVRAAHLAKVVHRDLKPENVFLMQTATKLIPKVLDFGLARVLLMPGQTRLTATGITMGTPYFMSPEQVQGDRNIDARTDVWALGVMLYELLTGKLPFHGDSEGAVYVRVCTVEPTPVELLAPWISADLAKIVGRCLRKDSSRRYPDAAGVLRDLTHVLKHEPVEPTLIRGVVSTQQMQVQPVVLSVPSASLHPTLVNPMVVNLPPVPWQPDAQSPAAKPKELPPQATVRPKIPKVWVFAVVFGISLLLVAIGLGALLFWQDDEDYDNTDRVIENSSPRVPTPFTPRVTPNAPTTSTPVVPPVAPPPVAPPPTAPPPTVPPPTVPPPTVPPPAPHGPALSPKPPADNSAGSGPSPNSGSSQNNNFPFPIENNGQ